MKKFDLFVIGTGPSGGRVATKCAEAGWSVALAESRAFGGTCALRGCNPKKVLVHAAEVVDAAKRSNGKLCDAGGIRINWPDLIKFKQSFVEDIPENSREKYDEKGIKTFLGGPKFISPTQVKINDEIIEPKKIVIATGAMPRKLGFEGEELLVTSDQFLNLETLPKRIIFVGGGYISFEFAHVAVRAGSDVTIVERGTRPLKGFDSDLVGQLVKKSEQLGMQVHVHTKVTSIKKTDGGTLRVSTESDGDGSAIEADLVVHGAGRVPNLDGLDLGKGDVEFDDTAGVIVDRFLRSKSNPIVMATGDCAATGAMSLTPTANADGYAVVKTLLTGDNTAPSYGPVPAVAFTIPSIASVGLSEAEATQQNLDFEVNQRDVSDWGSVKKTCESVAWFKTIVDKSNNTIIGAHLIGPGAEETINLFAVAMKAGLTVKEIRGLSLAFPTYSYNLREMV